MRRGHIRGIPSVPGALAIVGLGLLAVRPAPATTTTTPIPGSAVPAGRPAPAPADTVATDTSNRAGSAEGAARRDTTWAKIVNETDYTMRIVLLPESGASRFLGMLAAFDSATYVLPDYKMGPTRTIQFLAHPIGGPVNVPSGQIYVGPGETVEWRIQPPLPFQGG
jgi:hypothetical protein